MTFFRAPGTTPDGSYGSALIAPVSRRELLKRAAALGLGSITVTGLLAACDDEDDTDVNGIDAAPESDDDAESDEEIEDDHEAVDDSDDVAAPDDQERSGGAVVMGMNREPDLMDQHVGSSRYNEMVNANIYESLIEYDHEGGYIPGLADSWELSDDGLSATFSTKEGVTFHDDTAFDANAVKFNFDRIADPDTNSQKAVGLLGPYEASTVIDDSTVEVTMTETYAGFIDAIASFYLVMQSPTAIEDLGEDYGQNPVGTGPFMFSEWVQGDHLTLVRNPDYDWAPDLFDHSGPAYLDEITFRFIAEDATRVTTLETAETDVIVNTPLQDFDRIDGDSNFDIVMAPVLGQPPSMIVNTEKAPTDDFNVRLALEHAVNQDEIIDVVYYGVYERSHGPLTQYNRFYNSDIEGMYQFDQDRAMELLEEAGWEEGPDGIREKDGERLELVYLTFPAGAGLGELIQAQLRQVGIDIEILQLDNPANLSTAQAGDHNIRWLNWLFSDAGELSTTFHTENIGSGWNFTRYRDEELDDLLDQGHMEMDDDEREQIYYRIQEIVMENALIVPMYVGTQVVSMREGVRGLRIHQLGDTPLFYDVYLED